MAKILSQVANLHYSKCSTVDLMLAINLSRISFLLTFMIDQIETERKLNVHKTFRRRPGRLLSALCTFNLRPVSTGFMIDVMVSHF